MNKSNVESLSEKAESIKRDLREVGNGVVDHADAAMEEATSRTRRLAEAAGEAARATKERVSAAYDRTSEGAQRAYRGARVYARHNPLLTAAVTFASGIGIGLLLAPRGSRGLRSVRQGFLPVAAVALAHAVLEVLDETR
jgi:ElaB/YqjD/DUF883 family membrane-anchored ribosome-binding protein